MTESDPALEERRRIRRRRKLRLKAALLGRSSGGQTSKVHLAADRKCRPPAFILTTGQPAVHPRPEEGTGTRARRPIPHPAGRGRRGQGVLVPRIRAHLRKRRIKAVIPEKGSRGGRPVSHDADLYNERNTVERLINKLKAWRGIATRYDKTPDSYLAGLHLRTSMIWIKDLSRTTR